MAGAVAAMSDEQRLSAAIARQARAQALMDNELLQEAFARLEDRYLAEWRISQLRDSDARERLWQAVNVLGKVKGHLAKIVSDGKLAQREIDQLAQKRKRFGIV
jgi:predicted DNA-binding protein